MENTKVLFISQEITPYLPENHLSTICRNLPQRIQEKGKEIRTFMPRYGCINERRNQLHEVIRLSGMNLIINDADHPLIIKVASIQAARMQVYFIDNEDYFHRKFILKDEKGQPFEDNDERAIFYAKGVIETVRKLRWAPDIIHCHGWFTSLVPLYISKLFHDDPLFSNSKIIYSLYNSKFKGNLNKEMRNKIEYDGIIREDIDEISTPNYISLNKLAIKYADGIIFGSDKIDDELMEIASNSNKPLLQYHDEETYADAYSDFYDKILTEIINEAT